MQRKRRAERCRAWHLVEAFFKGMADLGYQEGRDVHLPFSLRLQLLITIKYGTLFRHRTTLMKVYDNHFLDALERIEAVHKERTVIEVNMATILLNAVLGDDWCNKRVRLNSNPDAFMLNGNDMWLAAHPVPPPDMRRIMYTTRVIHLSDAMFTIVPKVVGFERFRQRFHKRNDTQALYSEAQIASLLVRNGASVQIIGESGKRGEDFDLLATVRGVPVSVEVSGFESGALSVRTILNKLRSKRRQVPADRPAVLYLIVPDDWMKNYTTAFLVFNQAIVSFMQRSKRFNAIVLLWEGVTAAQGGGWAHGGLQPVYNNSPRWRIPDLSVFSLKRDKWSQYRTSDSFLAALRSGRFRKQLRTN
jgi:hypothetical protein